MPILLCCPLPFGSWNSFLLLGKEVEWDIWTKLTQCLPSVQASRPPNGFSWRIGCFWNQIIFQNFIIFTILDSLMLESDKTFYLYIYIWIKYTHRHTQHGASQVVLVVKNQPDNTGDVRNKGSISGLRTPPRGGNGNLLQYSCLENPDGQRSMAGYSPWDMRSHVGHDWSDWAVYIYIYIYTYIYNTHTHTHNIAHVNQEMHVIFIAALFITAKL